MSVRLTEIDLKAAFLEHARECGMIDETSIIASEFSLGRAGRRVDLAILAGRFIGVEFKSKYDSLRRLGPQLDAYTKCFDQVILVVDERHLGGALSVAPTSVELWTVDDQARLALVKRAIPSEDQSVLALADLCAIRSLRRIASAPSGASRKKLSASLEMVPLSVIYEAAIVNFKDSFVQSSETFWGSIGSSKIDRSTLIALSRFAPLRQKQSEQQDKEEAFWKAWANEASAVLAKRDQSVVGIA
jgi:hypothetical protein